ncbi:MAG: hypothetical protein N2691_01340 [Patescibacteria group bacterium]|nr:hypothetical protein [Patescibacteria group bacterium]
MKTVLIGFMGSGKTAVARALAEHSGSEVLETDALVLDHLGCADMSEVFQLGGELLLRETEIEIARSLRKRNNVIISTGGGMVMNKICIDYLREGDSLVVFLDAAFETLRNRVAADPTPRPLFTDARAAQALYSLRYPLYKAYADRILPVGDASPEELAKQIVQFQTRS